MTQTKGYLSLSPDTGVPVYCRQCSSRDTFVKDPDTDIYGVRPDGERVLMWQHFRCSVCGHVATRLVSAIDKVTARV